MDWKSIAIEKLKDYQAKRQALESISLEIAQVESAMISIRSASADAAPVKNSKGNGREDMLLNSIVRKDELQRILERTQLWIEEVDGALSVLDPDDRKVLEYLCIYPAKGGLDRLCNELFVEPRQVYKRREKALRKFTIALYGCTES